MKNIRFLMFVLTIGTLVLSACGGAAAPAVGSGKVEAMPVAFIGTVDSMAGDQWVISGTTVTVDPTVVRDGPFNVGDQVKVEGLVNADGSFTVSRVEVPTSQDASTLPKFGNDNSNTANTNDANANINDDHGNDANINDDHSSDVNLNDDNGNAINSDDTNINDDNSNFGNTNDDNSNAASSNNNTNDDQSGSGKSGKGGGGNDNSGSGKGKGGGSGGNSNDD